MCELCLGWVVSEAKLWPLPLSQARSGAGTHRGHHTVNAVAVSSFRLFWSWLGRKWNKFGGFCWGYHSCLR